MGMIEDINRLSKEHIKKLSDDFIKLCHNEYIRRWSRNNRDKVNSYQRDYYKKHRKVIHNDSYIEKSEKEENHNNSSKADPMNIVGGRL